MSMANIIKEELTLIYCVRRKRVKYLKDSGFSAWIRFEINKTHKKKPCVVDNVHPRLTNSVVVTFVQVIHSDKS